MENGPKINNISKNALFEGFFVIPRPLYNSNMPKVSIVKWSQNMFLLTEVPFLAHQNILKIAVFNKISKSGVGPKKGFPSTKIMF